MDGKLEAVKNSNPCPICGHPDWCYFVYGDFMDYKNREGWDDGALFICCRRADRYANVSDAGSRGGMMETVETPRGTFVNLGRHVDKQGVPYNRFQDLDSFERKETFWNEKKLHKGHTRIVRTAPKKEAAPVLPKKKPEVVVAPPQRLDEVYRAFLSLLPIEQWTIDELKNHDGWSEEMIKELCSLYMIRSMPPTDFERFNKDHPRYEELRKMHLKANSRKRIMEELLFQVGEPLGVPGFQLMIKDGTRAWRFTGMEGYLIPVYDPMGYIVRLRIRCSSAALKQRAREELVHMYEEAPEKYKALIDEVGGEEEAAVSYLAKKSGKYKWMSAPADHGGVPSGTVCGFYGLDLLALYMQGRQKRVFITEGEKKGIVTSYLWQYLVVTLPGVAQYHMLANDVLPSVGITAYEWFKTIGVTTICIAFDADMKSNPMVLQAAEGACREAYAKGFKVEIVSWSAVGGKGCDDAALNRELPVLTPLRF